MRVALAAPLAILLPSLVCAGTTVAHARVVNDAPSASAKGVVVTPSISASLGQQQFAPGEKMVLTVTENIWAKHTFKVTDSTGAVWTLTSEDNKSALFSATAKAPGGQVFVTMTRTFDKATASASTSYSVAAPAPPPPPPAPKPTPPPTPAPVAAWPGHQPGKFYLGMSCGTACDDKISQLGQDFGVHRQFKNWGDLRGIAKDIQEDHAADRLPWISIKPPLTGASGWQAVGDGSFDADIVALAETLKANDEKPVLITFHHEPSNDGTEAEGALWASAYVRFHDVLKAEGALANVADPPILGDWLFNDTNRQQDPANWATNEVLKRAPFMGVDLYENESGETFAQRIPVIIDWMADRGFPNKMVGIGESAATDTGYDAKSSIEWINESLSWAANNTDKVGVVSYFNSTANSRAGVYWPLDETSTKLATFRNWLNNDAVID